MSEFASLGFNTVSDALELARKNPGMAGAAMAGAGGLTLLAAPAVIVTPAIGILNVAGFGSGGIVAGKLLGSLKSVVELELIFIDQVLSLPLSKPQSEMWQLTVPSQR